MKGARRDRNDLTGTIRLAGAASILIATAADCFRAPSGSPDTSAGFFGGIAAVDFAARRPLALNI